MAGESHIAFAAKFRKRRGFGFAELFLFGRIHHAGDRLVHDIAQLEFGINKVVAGEQISIVLEGEAFSAIFEKQAESRAMAGPNAERDIEHLHENLAHIPPHPSVKNGNQKVAIHFAGYTPASDGGFRLPWLWRLGVVEASGFLARRG